MSVARSADEAFEQIVRRALSQAWGAALDASTDDDFRDAEGHLDEEAYLRYQSRTMERLTKDILGAHRRAQRPTNSGPPGSVEPA